MCIRDRVWIGDVAEEAILGLDFIEEFSCHWNWNKGGLQRETLNKEDSIETGNRETMEEIGECPSTEDECPLWLAQHHDFSSEKAPISRDEGSTQALIEAGLEAILEYAGIARPDRAVLAFFETEKQRKEERTIAALTS